MSINYECAYRLQSTKPNHHRSLLKVLDGLGVWLAIGVRNPSCELQALLLEGVVMIVLMPYPAVNGVSGAPRGNFPKIETPINQLHDPRNSWLQEHINVHLCLPQTS